MDGDGEDRPEEIIEFTNQIKNFTNKPIVGKRVKRTEKLIFKICYELHKLITFTFTGKSIKFGNFTCLPKSTVEKMINEKATWNSFSGSLTKLEKDLIEIPSWLADQLGIVGNQILQVKLINNVPKGKYIKLRPETEDFFEIPGFVFDGFSFSKFDS